MTNIHSANVDHAKFWSSEAGPSWVTFQSAMDQQMQPLLERLLTRAELLPGHHVLDIGSGTGVSTIRAAAIVGSEGRALGVDISNSMLDHARLRSEGIDNVEFYLTDAAIHSFEPASFDNMISRFGVMFFGDSTAAFRNISAALKPGAQMTFACWGQILENPWFYLPAQAAGAILGAPPKPDPDAPGPFAFRDIDRICTMLSDAGLTGICAEVESVPLTPPGTLEDVAELATRIGAANTTLTHFSGGEDERIAVQAGIVEAFTPFDTGRGIEIPAEIIFYQATVPQA